jgi:hypothetical protein
MGRLQAFVSRIFPPRVVRNIPQMEGEGYQASAPLHSLSSPALLSVHLLGTVAKSRQEI